MVGRDSHNGSAGRAATNTPVVRFVVSSGEVLPADNDWNDARYASGCRDNRVVSRGYSAVAKVASVQRDADRSDEFRRPVDRLKLALAGAASIACSALLIIAASVIHQSH
jgi:hypothetical protein